MQKILDFSVFINKWWIGSILSRDCRLKHVIEGKIQGRTEVTGGRGRNCKHPLDDLKETKGYIKLTEETQNRPL